MGAPPLAALYFVTYSYVHVLGLRDVRIEVLTRLLVPFFLLHGVDVIIRGTLGGAVTLLFDREEDLKV